MEIQSDSDELVLDSPEQPVEESQIKWGEGFIPNIGVIINEFIQYRGIKPLRILFLCNKNNDEIADMLTEISTEMDVPFFSQKQIILNSADYENCTNEELKEIYADINANREEMLEEAEKETEKNKNAKKPTKVNPSNLYSQLISEETLQKLVIDKVSGNVNIPLKGLFLVDVCSDFLQFLKFYEAKYFGKIDLVLEININDRVGEINNNNNNKGLKIFFIIT